MKPAVVRALCDVAYRSGGLSVAARLVEPRSGARADGRFQILVYHRVGPQIDPFFPGTLAAVFERQMRYIRRHFEVLSLTALMQASEQREIPPRAIAVTFDDGYEDLYQHVLPIVRRYDIPITIFLATGFIDADEPMWNDAVGFAIRDTGCSALSDLPGLRQPAPLQSPAQRQEAFVEAQKVLKYQPLAEREELVQRIVRDLRVPAYSGPRMLNWAQVAEMHASGVEFGAHTVRHPILTCLPPGERWREIADSKRAIEERLQMPVAHFAYPNGTVRDFDDATKELVRKAGFSSAVTTVFGTNTPATDRYALRRGGPWEEAISVFATKLWWYRSREAS